MSTASTLKIRQFSIDDALAAAQSCCERTKYSFKEEDCDLSFIPRSNVPKALNCYLLIWWAFGQACTEVPRDIRKLSRAGNKINENSDGNFELRPGDLVFSAGKKRHGHVGIIDKLSDDEKTAIHACYTCGRVVEESLRNFKEHSGKITQFRRIAV